jgi:hypothetical protein
VPTLLQEFPHVSAASDRPRAVIRSSALQRLLWGAATVIQVMVGVCALAQPCIADNLLHQVTAEAAASKIPPILPGIRGFGTSTVAGSGRHRVPARTTLITVTTLRDDGAGSLRACIDHSTPRTCIFEVSGEIKLRSQLTVSAPYLTVAGQTAPEPGITISGGTLRIETHDVLIQHLAIRPGDGPSAVKPSERDGISIGAAPPGSAHHVVIDHVSATWAIDENISTWYPSTHAVTISNSLIAEGLHNSIHPKGAHSKGILIGDGSRRVSLIQNLIALNVERNPYLKPGSSTELLNNVVYGWGSAGGWNLCNISDSSGSRAPTLVTLIGNLFKPAPWSFKNAPVYGRPVAPGTRVYVHDNIGPNRGLESQPSDDWAATSLPPTPYRAASPPIRSDHRISLSASASYEYVLRNAGSRPRSRSTTDARIISDVRSGGGAVRDCVVRDCTAQCQPRTGRNGGDLTCSTTPLEKPQRSERRRLTPPKRSLELQRGTRYTRLELWLQEAARTVEEPKQLTDE